MILQNGAMAEWQNGFREGEHAMTGRAAIAALALLIPSLVGAQSSFDLAKGRPVTPGITRTTIRDDAKVAVTRVRFAPGAAEMPHTHPYDVMLIPVTSGTVDLEIGDRKITSVRSGDVQFVPHDVTHSLANTGTKAFELIAVGVK
jgi:quercetin dioxygenase-like cupin family protein